MYFLNNSVNYPGTNSRYVSATHLTSGKLENGVSKRKLDKEDKRDGSKA